MSWRPWRMTSATAIALACAPILCAVGPVLASPRTDPTAGRAVFTGAATPNATSIDINPAALGLGVRTELYLAAVGVLDLYSIDLKDIDPTSGALSAGPPGISDYTVSPGGTLAGVFHSGDESRITLGVELLHTPPGERFLENEAFRYHTLGGYHRMVSPLTLAASLRVTKQFYIGVSIAAQSNFMRMRYARDTALDAGRDPARGIDSDCDGAPCGLGNPAATERYTIETDSGLFSTSVLAVNLGVVIALSRDTWLGIGYHTPPGLEIQNTLTGTMDVERAPRDGGETLHGASSVYLSQPASVDIELRSRLPRYLDLHVGARWEDLSRFQMYDVRGYGSTLPPAGIPEWQPRPRGFHDTFAAWAGVEQVERERPLVLGGRLGVESAALSDRRTSPLTIAPASATLDVGAQYRLSPSLVVQATYGLQYFVPVSVDNSAFNPRTRLACIESGYNYDTPACASVRNGYAIQTAAGDYSRIEQALRLAVRIELP